MTTDQLTFEKDNIKIIVQLARLESYTDKYRVETHYASGGVQ